MKKFPWIWAKNDNVEKDSYAEFKGDFSVAGKESVHIFIACDSVYNLEINGKLVAFGACADYPHRKYYDEIDITEFCQEKNEIKITVWYIGNTSSTYAVGERGLGFCVEQNGALLLESDTELLSRKNIAYKNDYRKIVTSQMGYSYLYDNTVENTLPYEKSEVKGEITAYERGRKNCQMIGRVPVEITKIENGYRVDMKREVVGFLELDIVSPKAQKLTVAFGEHLENEGKVLRKIGGRDFSVEFIAKEGGNKYCNAFRRLAGRYLDIECETELEIRYIGLNEVVYPQTKNARTFEDPLMQKIYDVCVHTLVCCMHDHYEDCPWREQALYTMDSRNQMLCGYYAFEGTEFQRHCLSLIGEGLHDNGLLEICFPSGKEYTIPFFSLIYPIQVYEYDKYTGDHSLKEEARGKIEKILNGFKARIEENGLISAIKGHWNFYEWSDGSDFTDELQGKPSEKHYDLIANCAYVYACEYYDKLYGTKTDNSALKKAIKENFFVAEKGLYKLSIGREEKFSRLGNSFAMLNGLEGKEFAQKLIQGEMVDVTLSMATFYYDALLKADKSYEQFIIEDIKKKYKKMLDAGSTTFWETELGWVDFGWAGSLCHGWSALPVYYFLMNEEA